MTEKRRLKIKSECERRLNEWLSNSTFEEMSVKGSFIRFEMSLGLLGGYPFTRPKWMIKKKFTNFITEDEFYSKEYNDIVKDLFSSCIKN